MSPLTRSPRGRTVVAAGVIAGIPVIWATVRAVADHWTPFADRAVIAVRSFDVLSSHPPVVGQYTQWSAVLGRPVFSPGPLLYWLLAAPARLPGGTALPIWIATFNLVCLVGVLAMARRRGGPPLLAATAVAVPLMLRSLPSETFHDVWNPATTLLPFLLACLTAWSVGIGEVGFGPLLVLLLSFVVQTHSAYALPGLGLAVVALGGAALARDHRPARARWMWASIAVAAACWAVPIADQLAGTENLRALVDASRSATGHLGPAAGWHAVVRALGIPPWWLRPWSGTVGRFQDVQFGPGWASQASCALLIAGLIRFLVVGVLRRRLEIMAPAACCLVLVLALGVGAAATPTEHQLALTVAYTLWWASPAGLFVWVTSGWLVASEVGRLGWGGRVVGLLMRARVASTSAVVVSVAAAAVVVAVLQPADGDRGDYRPFAAAANAVTAALPHPRAVDIAAEPPFPASELAYGLAYAFRREGATVTVRPEIAAELGRAYAANPLRDAVKLVVTYGRASPPRGRLLSRVRVSRPAFPTGTFEVTLAAVRRQR